jgi:hypothetical protein
MSTERLTPDQLKTTGALYDYFIEDWLFYDKAFKAGKIFIEEVIFQHPSETDNNYAIRLKEAFNFPYCQNIVSIYNYFLTEKEAIREIDPEIAERKDWKAFQKNCDFYGTNFDFFINDTQRLAGIYGTAGVLIDMQSGDFSEEDDEYAYLSAFTPNNILDWTFERDFKTRRPVLTYLKLREDANNYLIWTPKKWDRYKIGSRKKTQDEIQQERLNGTYNNEDYTEVVVDYSSGVNRLNEVPFVFLPNIRSAEYFYLGTSDIVDASLVNGAIARVLSMGNEVMKLAGFPMLLYPYESENQYIESNASEEVIVSEDSILQFDPDAKNGKPAWLESPVEASIDAILKWIDRLAEEMYRAVNLAGLHQNRDKAQTKSGTYLRYQFQQTNSVLSKKADTLVEAEERIYYFWGLWQNIKNINEKISVQRVKHFSIDAMQVELQNMVDSMEAVLSDTYKNKMQTRIAKQTYPDLTETELKAINDEVGIELAKNDKILTDAYGRLIETEPSSEGGG